MEDGWVFVLIGVIYLSICVLAATGRMRRNFAIGLRVEPLMRSPWHWREGHRAAGQVLIPTAALLIGYGLCMVLSWPAWLAQIPLDLLRVAGVVTVLGGLCWGLLRGVGAVMHGPPDDDAPAAGRRSGRARP